MDAGKQLTSLTCAVVLFEGISTGKNTSNRDDLRGPPPEACEACTGKSESDAVTVTTPSGDTINATCKTVNGELAATPDSPPADQLPEPPGDSGDRQ